MNYKVKQGISISLMICSCVGVVATSYATAKNTLKYKKAIEDKKDITKKEKTKLILKNYWPTILAGAGTIAGVVSGFVLNKRTEASLIAAATVIDQGWRKYKDKVKEKVGFDKNNEITQELNKESKEYNQMQLIKKEYDINDTRRLLYYEEHVGLFTSTPEYIADALRFINSELDAHGKVRLIDFYKEAQVEFIDQNMWLYLEDQSLGWSKEQLRQDWNMDIDCIEIQYGYDNTGITGDDTPNFTLSFVELPMYCQF